MFMQHFYVYKIRKVESMVNNLTTKYYKKYRALNVLYIFACSASDQ